MKALIYNASAGSGKTYRLAYKYVRDVVSEPRRYRHILAVTFTNKATEEMKSRILREIDRLASGEKSPYLEDLKSELGETEERIRAKARDARAYILHDYSRFTILTIDTFFQRILRAFIQELGLDLNYNIEIESSTLMAQSADALVEQITSDNELKKWLLEFIEERVEDGKKWSITDGILALSREIEGESNRDTLEKGLSKGELRDIVSRTVQLSTQTKEDFIAKGREMMEIITSAGCSTSDFKGGARSFANYFAKVAGGEVVDPTKTHYDLCENESGWTTKSASGSIKGLVPLLQPRLRELLDIFERGSKIWNTAALIRENYRSFALLSDLYSRVKAMCDEQNMMLLSETKLILSEFIKDNDAPFIYEKVGNRFEYFMIDEFQDTSLKEWGNFVPLLQNAMSQSEESSVLIVGDIKQSIYRWRGGDWRILHSGAREELGAEETTVLSLQDNYRSLPLVVKFNNQIISKVVENDNAYLNATLANACEAEVIDPYMSHELTDMLHNAYLDHSQTPRRHESAEGFIEVTTYTKTPPIIERVKDAIDLGFKPSDIMILTRGKSDGAKIANMLLEFKEENTDPKYRFDVMTQESLLVGYAPVSCFIIANMKLALNPKDATQLAIYNNFLGDRLFDEALSISELEYLVRLRMLSPEEAFEEIVIFHNMEYQRENIAYLQAIHELLINFTSSRIGDLDLFIKWWEEHGYKKALSVERSDSTIEIMTVHKAKGLEKRVVIIPYCHWDLGAKVNKSIVWTEGTSEIEDLGSFPVRYKSAMGNSHFSSGYYRELVYSHIDHINILYVALTRAAESLHILIDNEKLSTSEKTKNSNVGKLIMASIADLDAEVVTSENGTISYRIGVQSPPVFEAHGDGQENRLHIMQSYPTSRADLRLRLPSQRYSEEDSAAQNSVELSARNLGILMHKAFEEAATHDEIYSRIEIMAVNGQINRAEKSALRDGVDQILTNPQIREWFSDTWDEIRNENDIIIPRSTSIKRPDRVMIRGKQAVIVDYKFGASLSNTYIRQVRGYMELLRQMGYTDVQGYLWYIKSGEIIPC